MTPTTHRTIIVPGEGVVVRWPGAVVVIGGGTSKAAECLVHLTEEHDEPPAAGMLIERIRSLEGSDLAAAVFTPAGIRLLRQGIGRAELVDATAVSSASALERTEFDVDVTATPLWIGLGDVGEASDARSDAALFDLELGIVPGRGVLLDAGRRAPAPAPAPAPFEVVDLGARPDERRDPLPEIVPTTGTATAASTTTAGDSHADHSLADHSEAANQVLGIECSRGHFNNPIAAYCQVCGISMVHMTHHLVPGTRPTLGYIVFDNGATYALDRPYVIGREPTPEPGSGLAPLVADDLDHTVSRDHAELTFDGWDVLIADLGSTNGTFHWDRTSARWERVLPNHPVVIAPGVSVAIGRKTFVYETVARSV